MEKYHARRSYSSCGNNLVPKPVIKKIYQMIQSTISLLLRIDCNHQTHSLNIIIIQQGTTLAENFFHLISCLIEFHLADYVNCLSINKKVSNHLGYKRDEPQAINTINCPLEKAAQTALYVASRLELSQSQDNNKSIQISFYER